MRARGSIVIVVAHRPSAIEPMDHLLYLREGKQSAFGEKADVLAKVLSPQKDPNLLHAGTYD
jgi:ATP-binding cassette subfamily C protein